MGFKDDFSSMVNRGTAAASRKARQVSLGSKANELRRQRQTLVAQLGASLYEEVRTTPSLRAGREELIAQIEAVDAQRHEVEEEQRRIQMESDEATVRATTYHCAVCGAPIRATDQFCSTCGAPADQALPKAPVAAMPAAPAAAPSGPVCSNCGAPIAADDVFCMNCGARVEVAAAPEPEPESVVVPDSVVVPESVAVPEPEPVVESAQVVDDVEVETLYEPVSVPEELSAVEDWKEDAFVTEAVEAPAPAPEAPVTNEQLDSEVEAAIAEELQIEDMVEEIKDEIEEPAPAPEPVFVPEPVPAPAPAPAPEPVPAPVPAPEPEPVAEVDVVAAVSERTCPNCGAPVPAGDLFCMNCGNRMDAEPAPAAPAPKFCQNCGAPIEEGFKFCGNCGAPVA